MRVSRLLAALAVLGSLVLATPAAAAPAGPARAAALAGPVIRSLDTDAAGKCLDAYNWGVGPWVHMYPCHGGANQVWTLYKGYGNGTFDVFYTHNGVNKCLDGVAGHGQQLTVWNCDRSTGQRFRQRGSEPGAMVLESVRYPGQCLDVSNWGRNTAVILFTCNLAPNQAWSRESL
ncbi:RICIN domain-containing protein [Actinoplanes aureus]|uniref:RICIN domain-containing protein n=1 Tax=Actinoplanes aureus TaxID=2792083 RepID=A0A931CES9_9ACTN|nr:RICIN domain-containing protein [Actinoplanes aureus]MBG0567274.1 RICIN domain-containing protein [Actinoplanes aureus]